MGAFWKWIPNQDFQSGAKPRTLPRGVVPAGARFTDLRTPAETVQMLGDSGAPVPNLSIDLGVADIRISDNAKTIEFVGKGLDTNVGNRIPNNTQGMTVNGGINRPSMGSFYPHHSASRQDLGTTAPRMGKSTPVTADNPVVEPAVQGINRVEISDKTKTIAEEPAPEPTPASKKQSGEYLDEDSAWLDSLDKPLDLGIPKRKTVNRTRLSRTAPRRSNPPTLMGGMRA